VTYVDIRHGHDDHFFGLNALKQRFPNVRAVATVAVLHRIVDRLKLGLEGVFVAPLSAMLPSWSDPCSATPYEMQNQDYDSDDDEDVDEGAEVEGEKA
jgi:glyoxylase-like metal-dependent hydrolase (beta-lactamase superfamily II)